MRRVDYKNYSEEDRSTGYTFASLRREGHPGKRRKKLPEEAGERKVFSLPSNDGCNKVLQEWMKSARIEKKVTWSCARLSFSMLLQDKNVHDATVAYLMGHTSTDQIRSTYKRHRPKDQATIISLLPSLEKTLAGN